MPKEVLVHEVVVALRIGGRQADVFVEVERRHLGEIQQPLAMHPHQLLVHAERRRASRHP